jgi:leucyl-tRNA synthetase
MFIGPWEEGGPYRPQGIEGITRWLNRVWTLVQEPPPSGTPDPEATRALRRTLHQYIRRVTEDIEHFRFNTMLSKMMELTNALRDAREANNIEPAAWQEAIETLLLLLAPSAPHLAEELWERTGRPYSVHAQRWPQYDPALAAEEEVTIVVQVNGRVRDRITVPIASSEEEVRERALSSPRVREHLGGARVSRVIYVPGKLINVVLDGR